MSVKKEALAKIQRYCAYQERCHSEVRNKLLSLKIYGDDLEAIITELIQEDFLNEQRFAEAYVGGKFRIKKWGRLKIKSNLKIKKVSDYCIKKGLKIINEDDYTQTLKSLIEKYKEERKTKKWSQREMEINCIRYFQNRGYEYPLIKSLL